MLSVVLTVVTKVLLYCLVLLVGLWCWFQLSHWKVLRAAAKIPSYLHPLPVIGHCHYMLSGLENITQWVLDTCDDIRTAGLNIFCFWIGPLPLIVLFGAEDIQVKYTNQTPPVRSWLKVLNMTSTAEKSVEYSYMKYALGDGLLSAPWKVWKVTRRHINPLFHPRNLEHMIPVFNRNSRELVTVLSAHVGVTPVNVFPHTMDTALKTVCHLIFGSDMKFNIDSEEFQGLREVVERVPEMGMNRTLRLWLRIDAVYNLIYKRELRRMKKLWMKFTEDPLKIATQKHENKMKNFDTSSNEIHHAQDSANIKNNEDMLSLLDVYKLFQKNFPNFSDKDLEHEMVTLYATGTDTVGLLTSSCLLALAYYPELQERVYTEILSVVGRDGEVTSQDLSRMPYLDQVYKETLRFFMVVPFIGRRTTEDIKLGSYFIPAGTTIVVALQALNMDPKVFPMPKTFDPEHFSPESLERGEKYSFIPYSGGPRNCIGKRYAEILMKITVVNVLRKFKLSTTMDIYKLKKKLSVTLVCTEGYNVSLESRN